MSYWNCNSCNYHNKNTRELCYRCQSIKQCYQTPSVNLDRYISNNFDKKDITIESTNTSNQLCIICLTNKKNAIFLHGNTAHQGACYYCAIKCNNICPLCRQYVDKVVKVY